MKLITKAFHLLDLFLDNGDELTLEEMARLSGQNKATVRRIAVTLIENGYLKQTVRRGKYSLGMRFLDFSGLIKKNNRILSVAAPYAIQLSNLVNESVELALWDGMRAALVQTYHADHLLKVVPDEGTQVIMYSSSIGKAILAELPEENLTSYAGEYLQRFTPNTIDNLQDLRNHLRVVKQEGVAFDDEEYALGVRGLGAAFKTGRGELVGALGIVGPSVRLTRASMREWVPHLKSCVADISKAL